MMGKERRSSESLCEKSMVLVANLIKLSSSISFAKPANNEPSIAGSMAAAAAATPLIPGSRRLQERRSRAKPIYLTKPSEGDVQIGHGSPNVDGWASEFIEKVHENRKKLDESATKKPYSIAKTRRPRSSSVLN